MTPKKPKTTLPKPKMPRAPRAPKAGPPKKRTKRPTCRRADTFPCGYVCKNQYYKDKTGTTKETQCGNLASGQSETYIKWVKDQTQRIEEINAKRAKKGLAPVETTPALMIDKGKTKKLRPDYQKAKQAEKDAKKEARKAEREAKKAEQGQAPKKPAPAKEKANISEITKEAKTIEDTAKALSDEQLDAMLKTASFRNSFSGAVIDALKAEKARRRGGKPEEEKPEPPKPKRTIKKPTVVDRKDLLPRYRKSFIPEKHKPNLSPIQQEGVARAIMGIGQDGQGGFIMADGAGLGKTRQQLAIADYYASQGKKVLIISPNAVIKPDYKTGQVAGSFKDDGAAMDVKFTLSKGESALEDGNIYLGTYQNIDKFKDLVDKNTVVLLDEAHAFKNLGSQRTKHGMDLLDNVGGVLYATATPADKPDHLYYLHRADVFSEAGASALARHMGISKRTDADGKVTWGKADAGGGRKSGRRNTRRGRRNEPTESKLTQAEREAMAVSALFDELTNGGKMMRREISMENVKVNMQEIKVPDAAKTVMQAIEARYADEGSKAAARVLLDQRRQLEPFKVPAAIDLVKKAIKKGNQVVVFADRVNESSVYAYDGDDPDRQKVATSEGTIRQLREQLIKAGFDPDDIVELHGGAELKAADAMKLFQTGKRKIMLTTQGSGGTGINLDDVIGDKPRTLISLTPAFSANEFMQMIGRVWRSQTASIPEIHCLFSDLAIDNWGRGLLASKLVTLGAVVGGAPRDIRSESFAERLANLRRRNRYNPFLVA